MNRTESAIVMVAVAALIAVIVLGAYANAQTQYWSPGYQQQNQGYGPRGGMMGGSAGMMGGGGMMNGGGGMMGGGMMGGNYGKNSFSSNGERIYYTGIDSANTRVGVEGGPMWIYMNGGSCVNCHGANGKGGVPVMMGTATPADLTNLYSAHTHGNEKMTPYNDDLLKRAITKGIAVNGRGLDPTMPTWYMAEEDLNDLVAYIKTLQRDEEDHSLNNSIGGNTHNETMTMNGASISGDHTEHVHSSSEQTSNATFGNPSTTFLAAVASLILGSFVLVQYLKKSRM